MEQQTDRSFLGTGWGFPPEFDRKTYSIGMLSGEADVYSSIGIILNTITGERVMLPTFGCNLQPYLFEQMTESTIALIKKIVFEALSFHEPRIIVHHDDMEAEVLEGTLVLTIPYTIITTNTRYNYVYPFYTSEATNIEHG